MAGTSASTSNFGKRPIKWYFTDEQIMHFPSRKAGMDAASELKCRREAAEFIQEMAERLNHNVPHNRGQINQNCICIAMVHMHRFFVVHPFQLFRPKDIAAACLFLAGKSEECPRKLEHIVEVWFKLKYRKADVQPPFTEAVRKNGADFIVYLEQILLQTISFDLHVGLPHPIVIQYMQKFKLDNKKLVKCAYWFATDIIQLTNWCIRFSERTIACVCIFIAYSWADYEIPERSDGKPWFKEIDPEMSEELLHKLTDEFTTVYAECKNCHARRFIEKAKNENPSTMPAKSIAQLPPPPLPPVLQQQQHPTRKKETGDEQPAVKKFNSADEQQQQVTRSSEAAAAEEQRKQQQQLAFRNIFTLQKINNVKNHSDVKKEKQQPKNPPPPPPPPFSPNGQISSPPPPPPPIDGNGNGNDLEEGELL